MIFFVICLVIESFKAQWQLCVLPPLTNANCSFIYGFSVILTRTVNIFSNSTNWTIFICEKIFVFIEVRLYYYIFLEEVRLRGVNISAVSYTGLFFCFQSLRLVCSSSHELLILGISF
jgi:hypothetical protein